MTRTLTMFLAFLLALALGLAPLPASANPVEKYMQKFLNTPAIDKVHDFPIHKSQTFNEYVKKVQQSLKDLGYLSDVADGVFGSNTERAIALFQELNGRNVTGVLDYTTYNAITSTAATPISEMECTIVIPLGGRGEWKSRSGDKFDFRVQVLNADPKRTVKSFTLYYYLVDKGGDREPFEESKYFYKNFNIKISPGKTVYTDYVTFDSRSAIREVCATLCEGYYTDGTSFQWAPEDATFSRWPISW